MMSSFECVRRAIRFAGPDRLPFTGSMGTTDFAGDTVAVFPDFPCRWWLGGGGVDEWGCRWEIEPGSKDMGQVKNRVLEALDDYPRITLPDARNPRRYAAWEPVLARAEREKKYVVVCNGPCLFERTHFLYGFNETLMDIAAEPQKMRDFVRHVAQYHVQTIAAIAALFPGKIHGYRVTDDWGTQTGPLISPAAFRSVFQPVYTEIFRAIHAAGMDAWLHSCGHNLALLPLLAEAGLDVVNLMQPNVFPIPALEKMRGQICFEVCADAQTSLPADDRAAVAREIRQLVQTCATPEGGLIEVKLDQMYFDGDHVSRAMGDFCHALYRELDPYRR